MRHCDHCGAATSLSTCPQCGQSNSTATVTATAPATAPTATPAGWYPDPEGSGRQRYWDTARWTDAYADDAPPSHTVMVEAVSPKAIYASTFRVLATLLVVGIVAAIGLAVVRSNNQLDRQDQYVDCLTHQPLYGPNNCAP